MNALDTLKQEMEDQYGIYRQTETDYKTLHDIFSRYSTEDVPKGPFHEGMELSPSHRLLMHVGRVQTEALFNINEKARTYINKKYDEEELSKRLIELICNDVIPYPQDERLEIEKRIEKNNKIESDRKKFKQVRDVYNHDGRIYTQIILDLFKKYCKRDRDKHLLELLENMPEQKPVIEMAFDALEESLSYRGYTFVRIDLNPNIPYDPGYPLNEGEEVTHKILQTYNLIMNGDL